MDKNQILAKFRDFLKDETEAIYAYTAFLQQLEAEPKQYTRTRFYISRALAQEKEHAEHIRMLISLYENQT